MDARPAFHDVPHTAAQHFRLALHGVIARVIGACTGGDLAAAFEALPFLQTYR